MFHLVTLVTSDAGIQIIYIWLAILFGIQFINKILTYRLAKRGIIVPHESRLIFAALSELLFMFVFLMLVGLTGANPKFDRATVAPINRFLFFLIVWPESIYAISLTLAIFRLMWRHRQKPGDNHVSD